MSDQAEHARIRAEWSALCKELHQLHITANFDTIEGLREHWAACAPIHERFAALGMPRYTCGTCGESYDGIDWKLAEDAAKGQCVGCMFDGVKKL